MAVASSSSKKIVDFASQVKKAGELGESIKKNVASGWLEAGIITAVMLGAMFKAFKGSTNTFFHFHPMTSSSSDTIVTTNTVKNDITRVERYTRIAEARYEEERPTITIAKPNDLTTNVQVQDLEQTTQGRGDEPAVGYNSSHVIPYYHGGSASSLLSSWENCFSILNAHEADNTKPPLSDNTFGNNGGDDSETSGLVTPAKEVVDSGHSSTFSSLVEHGSPSVVPAGRRKPRGNGCRTLIRTGQRTLEEEKAKDETALFLEPQYSPPSILFPVFLLIEEYGIPESRVVSLCVCVGVGFGDGIDVEDGGGLCL
ncbi:hypothetical protein Tco_0155632 [Tanacetum coccineum]